MRSKLIIIIAVLVGVSLGVGGVQLLHTRSEASPTCSVHMSGAQSHSVMIMDDKAEPINTNGKLCDTLTITNMDSETRLIAFGPHDDHVPYDGIADKILKKDQSLTVTLNAVGSYRFHDHMHDEVQGYFTVTK